MASIVDDRGFNQGFQWTPTQETRMRRRSKAIVDAVGARANQRILELGCGTGELSHFISLDTAATVTGVDLCAPFVEQANARFGTDKLKYVTADLSKPEDIARLGGEWDAIVGNGILHHLYYVIDSALGRMRSLLKPGGKFVFWEPNLFNPYVFGIFSIEPLRKVAKLEPDEMAFTPRWIRGRLEQAGFVNVHVRFRDFVLPNLPYALVPTIARLGDVAEQLPAVDHLAQSLFIEASTPRS